MGYYGSPDREREMLRITGLGKEVILWDKIPHTKIMSLVRSYRTEVLDLRDSSNNYGEFYFITLLIKPTKKMLKVNPDSQAYVIEAYGLGENTSREVWHIDFWKINRIEEEKYHNLSSIDVYHEKPEALKILTQAYWQAEKDRGWAVQSINDITIRQAFSVSGMSSLIEVEGFDPDAIAIPAGAKGFLANTRNGAVTAKYPFPNRPARSLYFTFEREDIGTKWRWVRPERRSAEARLFSLIAGVNDDDGATTEIEDMNPDLYNNLLDSMG